MIQNYRQHFIAAICGEKGDAMRWLTLYMLVVTATAAADTLVTTSGRRIDCVVLQEDNAGVLAKMRYGTMRYPRSVIASITDPR